MVRLTDSFIRAFIHCQILMASTTTSQILEYDLSIKTRSSTSGSRNGHRGQPPYASPRSLPMPPANQVGLLGFVAHGKTAQKAVYGPPGASFDSIGNVYFGLGQGRKQWIGSYKD